MKRFAILFGLIFTGLLVTGQSLPGIHYSSWIGNTFGGKNSSTGSANAADPDDKWIQNFIDCMMVTEDGTCYTTSGWDEAHREYGIYKDGDVLGNENIHLVCDEAGGYIIVGTTISGNGKTITDAGIPTAIAMGRGIYAGKLLVADNGQRKQILIYDVSSTPVIVETLGVAGGIAASFTPAYEFPAAINAPAYPVKNYLPGNYHPLKLWGLTGVGCDNAGRIFVSTSELGSAIRCFKKVSNQWILDWRVEDYFFVDNIAYDEKTDAVDVYGVQEHFKMDFNKTTPGKEWSIAGYTLDASNYPEDPRGIPEIKAGGEHMLTSVETREINGTRYLWTHGMTCQPPVIYKFKPNSDIAVPCGMFFGRNHRIYNLPITFSWPPNRPSADSDETLFWSDINNDGKYQANEYASLQHVFNGGNFFIDKSGALWQGANPIKKWNPTFEANGNLVYNDANVEEITINGVTAIGKLKFQEEYDRLVILTTECRDIDGGKMYIIDNWSTGNRTARFVADLKGPHQSAWTVAGDYAFEAGWETKAKVWVTDLNTGLLVGTMIPDASCGGVERTGWVDISSGIKAYKRTSTGEYLVFVEDDYLGRVIMYRWCLGGNCLNGGAVKGLQLSPAVSNIKVGDSLKISRTFTPVNPNNINITWSSNNQAIATVNQNGLVTGVGAGTAEITALSQDGGFAAVSQVTVQAKFPVAHVQGAMKIDGKFDEGEWKIDSLIAKPVFGLQNNTGRFNLLWDENYLYVGATIKDGHVNYLPNLNPWENDALEVYLDGNYNKGTSYDSTDIQLIQTASNVAVWSSRTASGIRKAIALNDSGYSMEMAIPWGTIKRPVAAGATIGFDIGYDDNDNGTREAATTWFGDGNNYTNTANFDAMLLLPGTSGNVAVTGIVFDSTNLSLLVAETYQITAAISPINATNKNITWSTSNAAVATVDANGKISGLGAGTATITATTIDGGKTATCKVIVSADTWTIADDKDPSWTWLGLNQYDDPGCYGGTAHGGDAIGNYGSYTFDGTGVEYYSWNGPDGANMEIFIDDVSQGIYSLSNDPEVYNVKVFSVSNLTPGSHTIKIVSTEDTNWGMIDYIRYKSSAAFPLKLVSFSATLNNNTTQLKWVTENELNVSHFDIERSSDGNRFVKLVEITSKGGGPYNVVDAAPQDGVNYYRLKIVDKDGKFTYSKVALVKVLNDAVFNFTIYPNPNKGMLIIEPSLLAKPVTVSIFDQQGRIVLVKQITGITAININQLANGVYTVRLINNGEVKTAKLVKE